MAEKKTVQKTNSMQVILTVLLVGAAFAIGSMWTQLRMTKSNKNQPAQQQAADGQAQPKEVTELTDEQWQKMLAEPGAVIGDENAKVTMVELTDFQCPYCERYHTQTYSKIMKAYVETGEVKYVMRNLPLPFHEWASLAAEAVMCAGDQGKYEELHNELFKAQSVWAKTDTTGKASLTEDQVVNLWAGYAAKLGVKKGDFLNCVKNGDKKEAVAADLELAQQIGINGTPTFIINKRVLVGAQPYETFEAAIEATLMELE